MGAKYEVLYWDYKNGKYVELQKGKKKSGPQSLAGSASGKMNKKKKRKKK